MFIRQFEYTPYQSGQIERVESSYVAHIEYQGHQQFFPGDTKLDITETLEHDFDFNIEVRCRLTDLIVQACLTKHIVLVGMFGQSIRVDMFGNKM